MEYPTASCRGGANYPAPRAETNIQLTMEPSQPDDAADPAAMTSSSDAEATAPAAAPAAPAAPPMITIPLPKIMETIDAAVAAGYTPLLSDPSSRADTFFSYGKGIVCDAKEARYAQNHWKLLPLWSMTMHIIFNT